MNDRAADDGVATALSDLARNDAGRVLATLARRFGDLDLADEAVQEALIEASARWQSGVPDNPAGWLYRVALRKGLDRLRRADAESRRVAAHAPDLDEARHPGEDRKLLADDAGADMGSDERLRLMLLCTHPALDRDAQVALTLRLVAGLTTEEIAAAFLVPTSTLAARVTRAKKKIKRTNIPLSLPDRLDERIDALLATLYLIFNEGYLARTATSSPHRVDLCDEAIRLSRVVEELSPGSAEAKGLLALQMFIHARRDTRFTNGVMVPLDEQDRTAWHLDEIRSANRVLGEAMQLMRPGPYQLEAVIASHHANARTPADTDWPRIVQLYDQLMAMKASPVVELNRAVAVAMADGPRAGLVELDILTGLDDYHLFHSTHGELLARCGEHAAARAAFERALELAANPAEVAFLRTKLR